MRIGEVEFGDCAKRLSLVKYALVPRGVRTTPAKWVILDGSPGSTRAGLSANATVVSEGKPLYSPVATPRP